MSRLEDTGSYAVERGGSHGLVRQERVTVAESVPVALQKVGPAALPGLIQALSHPEKRIRRLAIAAIGRIDGSREDAAAPLGAGLFDDDADYRAAAAQALAAMGSDAAAAANELVRMFVSDPNVNNRVIAAHALGQLGEVSVVPALTEGTRHPDPEARAAAIQALGQLGPLAESSVPALVAAGSDDDHRANWVSEDFAKPAPIRVDAIEALGRIGPAARETVEWLTELLDDDQGPVRVAVALALWRIDPDNSISVPTLVAALANEHQETRRLAAGALCTLGASAEPALPALIAALSDKDWVVRFNAANAVGEIGPAAAEATPRMIELLLDKKAYFGDQVRRAAADALGKLGPGAVPHLLTALDHSRLPVRIAAANTLAEIGPPAWPAIARLQELLEDDHVTLRNAAAGALGRLRDAQSPDGARMLPGG